MLLRHMPVLTLLLIDRRRQVIADRARIRSGKESGFESQTRFVLHDSNGFEPGEQDNVKILHAIWLCIQTPSTGGRLLETGTEDFLKLKCGGQLGNVPVIVVFTQYDKLVDQVDYELGPSLHGLSDNAMKELIGGRADTKLQESATDS
ncbi:hypothetical protein M405DRAFT_604000 [Rhizopogon salebrosus TDB-379]|nr:hypothetical protein M405DRAFT_604000 [Rhizopogon salebrosus TDB-379]